MVVGFSRTITGLLAEHNVEYSSFNILADEEVRQGKFISIILSPPANEVWDKVMFLHVCHSVCKGGLPTGGADPHKTGGTHPTGMFPCLSVK